MGPRLGSAVPGLRSSTPSPAPAVTLDPELLERILTLLASLNLRGLDPELAAEVQAVMQRLTSDRSQSR